jgi:hypothetical protein
MRRLAFALTLGLTLALLPLVAQAADGEHRGFTLRIDGDYTLAEGESVGTVIVINGDVQIDGRVRDALIVIEGTATVTGTVANNVVVINGTLNLRSGSTVKDINLIRSDLNRDGGADVSGSIHRRSNVAFRGAWFLFSTLVWLGFTFAFAISAALFAAIAGRQLKTGTAAMTEELVNTIIGAVFLWIGAPILAVALFFTVIGIPASIGIVIILLPALAFLGYLVAGTKLGTWLLGLVGRRPGGHPYAAAVVGVIVLQLIILIPLVGWLVDLIAALWGSGALVFLAFRAARGAPPTAAQQPAPAVTPPAGA